MQKLFTSFFLVAVALVAPHGTACAQGIQEILTQRIRGVVTDEVSGYPVTGATIILDDKAAGTVTDTIGRFILDRVPVGRHSLSVSFLGYEPVVICDVIVSSAKEAFLEVMLKQSTLVLDEITIRPRIDKEKPLNAMALSGARMLSVEEARRYAGSMDDPSRLASCFAGVVSGVLGNGLCVHGNAPHMLQWRLEGVEIPNPNHFADVSGLGGGVFSSLSNQLLANSDFFSGAFPAEYNNALSGIFDMRMRNGNSQDYEHTFQIGVQGIDFASEGPVSRKHNSSYLINYRYATTSLLSKLGIEVIGETSKIDYQDLNFKLNFPTKKAGVFSVWSTALLDNYGQSPEKDMNRWESSYDRQGLQADQFMLAGGISHRYFFGRDLQWKTTLAVTHSQEGIRQEFTDFSGNVVTGSDGNDSYTNLILKSSLTRKFGPRLTNTTGISYIKMFYDMTWDSAPFESAPLERISRGDGNTDLISVFNQSLIGLSERVEIAAGINVQVLTLSNEWTVEPRISLRWQATDRSSVALAYGMYSRMEKMAVYFVRSGNVGNTDNTNLGVVKAHQWMLTYHCRLGNDVHLRIEPYCQLLYDVPVTESGSYSSLNRKNFWEEESLVSDGRGRNYGVDVTFEKYMTDGLYYMLTASFFDSKYRGGDGLWYDTRYNRKFVANGLVGKEWALGHNHQNALNASVRMTLQGGERYSPVDFKATIDDPDKVVQYDETRPFSLQFSPMFLAHFSINFRMNRKKVAHEFVLQVQNVTGCREFSGHLYNEKTGMIEAVRDVGISTLPNFSYRIHF